MTNPYLQQPYAPPEPPRRRQKDRPGPVKVALGLILGVLSLALIVVSIAALIDNGRSAAPTPAPAGSTVIQQPTTPSVDPLLAVPGRDLGAGTPDAGCATNRVGKYFVLNGVRYECVAPDYRWRRTG